MGLFTSTDEFLLESKAHWNLRHYNFNRNEAKKTTTVVIAGVLYSGVC